LRGFPADGVVEDAQRLKPGEGFPLPVSGLWGSTSIGTKTRKAEIVPDQNAPYNVGMLSPVTRSRVIRLLVLIGAVFAAAVLIWDFLPMMLAWRTQNELRELVQAMRATPSLNHVADSLAASPNYTQIAIAAANKSGDYDLQSKTVFTAFETMRSLGKRSEAIALLDQFSAHALSRGDLDTLRVISKQLRSLGEDNKSDELLRHLENAPLNTKTDFQLFELVGDLAFAAEARKAPALIERALKLTTRLVGALPDSYWASRALNLLALGIARVGTEEQSARFHELLSAQRSLPLRGKIELAPAFLLSPKVNSSNLYDALLVEVDAFESMELKLDSRIHVAQKLISTWEGSREPTFLSEASRIANSLEIPSAGDFKSVLSPAFFRKFKGPLAERGDQEVRQGLRQGRIHSLAPLLVKIALCHLESGNAQAAERTLHKAFELEAQSIPEGYYRLDLLGAMSAEAMKISGWAKHPPVGDFFSKVATRANGLKAPSSRSMRSKLLLLVGNALGQMGEKERATLVLSQAAGAVEEDLKFDPDKLAETQIGIGTSLVRIGGREAASKAFIRARQAAERQGDFQYQRTDEIQSRPGLLARVAVGLVSTDNLNEAQPVFERSLASLKSVKDRDSAIRSIVGALQGMDPSASGLHLIDTLEKSNILLNESLVRTVIEERARRGDLRGARLRAHRLSEGERAIALAHFLDRLSQSR